jgi:hypothetical protein
MCDLKWCPKPTIGAREVPRGKVFLTDENRGNRELEKCGVLVRLVLLRFLCSLLFRSSPFVCSEILSHRRPDRLMRAPTEERRCSSNS